MVDEAMVKGGKMITTVTIRMWHSKTSLPDVEVNTVSFYDPIQLKDHHFALGSGPTHPVYPEQREYPSVEWETVKRMIKTLKKYARIDGAYQTVMFTEITWRRV